MLVILVYRLRLLLQISCHLYGGSYARNRILLYYLFFFYILKFALDYLRLLGLFLDVK